MNRSQLTLRSVSTGAFGISAGCSIIGSHTSTRCPMMSPVNDGGATPTIVSGTLFTEIVRPTAERTPANRFCQYA